MFMCMSFSSFAQTISVLAPVSGNNEPLNYYQFVDNNVSDGRYGDGLMVDNRDDAKMLVAPVSGSVNGIDSKDGYMYIMTDERIMVFIHYGKDLHKKSNILVEGWDYVEAGSPLVELGNKRDVAVTIYNMEDVSSLKKFDTKENVVAGQTVIMEITKR